VDKKSPDTAGTPKGLRPHQATAQPLGPYRLAPARQYESMGLNMPAKVAEDLKVSARTVRDILDSADKNQG